MIQSGPGGVAIVGKKLSSLSQLSDVFLKKHRCLRTGLLLLLDETWNKTCLSSESSPCQYCLSNPKLSSLDVSFEARNFIRFLTIKGLLCRKDIFNILVGTHHTMQAEIFYGSLRNWTTDLINFFLEELLLQNLIETVYEVNDDLPMPYMSVTALGHAFVSNKDSSLILKFPEVVISQPFENNMDSGKASRKNVKRNHHVLCRRFDPKMPKKSTDAEKNS